MTSFDDLQRIARKNRLEDDPEVQQWLADAATLAGRDSPRTERLLRVLRMKIEQKAAKKTRQPFPEPEPSNYWEPNLEFGRTLQGNPVMATLDEIIHLGFFARSGGGKTTLFQDKMIELSQLPIEAVFWAIDFNQDYRHVANHEETDVIVIPFEKLRLNPLKPMPGVPLDTHRVTVAEIFADSQALLDASENFTDQQLQQLFESYQEIADDALSEVYDTTDREWPTLHDLERTIEQQSYHHSNPNSQYLARVLNRIQNLTSNGSPTVDCVHGHDLTELLHHNVIFEFDSVKQNVHPFFVELLYAKIQDYRQYNSQASHHHVLWFGDELKNQHSIYKEKQVDSGEPIFTERFTRGRNQRIYGWGADQLPRRITEAFTGNLSTLMLGPFVDYQQFKPVAKSMGIIDDPHQKRVARNLTVGEAIIKRGSDGPYKIRLHNPAVTEDVTDELLVELYRDDWERFLHDNESFTFETAEKPKSAVTSTEQPQRGREQPEEPTITLSETAERFLADIVANPIKNTTARYDLFSSVGKANRAKTELEDAGLIEAVPIAKEDSQIKLLDLTDHGIQYLRSNDVDIEWAGRGGIEHVYWQHRIRDRLEELGYAAEIEHQHRDVYGLKNSDVAIEVAMGKNEREIEHLEAALDRGYGVIIVAGHTPEVKGYIRRKAIEAGLNEDNVFFSTVQQVATMDVDFLPDA